MKDSLRRTAIILGLTCALFTPYAHAIPGQPGTLDATWATSSPLGAGKVITPIGSGNDFAFAMTLQPDGRVLLAGYCYNGSNYDFCAARYLTNGTLDTSWNGTGTVFTSIGGGDDRARAMTLQPDGKVLLAGYCYNGTNYDFCAARYLANGALDITWNGTGKVMTPIGDDDDYSYAMTLQPDGKVLVAGHCLVYTNFVDYDFCAARYLANGTLDTAWNGSGKVITAISSGFDLVTAMTLQPDGKVLLGGACSSVTTNDFCAARYLANGTLDNTWNGIGTVITPIGSFSDIPEAMIVQPNGNVLLAGECVSATSLDFCAARYLANGALDTTWNGTGKVITRIGSGYHYANAMILQPDGKVLLAGYCDNGTNNDFCAARYDGGPFGYQNCKPDIDGDGSFLATTDALINMRIALGITGSAVVNGITFATHATRNTWPLIRDYLVTQCGMSLVP